MAHTNHRKATRTLQTHNVQPKECIKAFESDQRAIRAKHPESEAGCDYELVDLVAEPKTSPCVQAASDISSTADIGSDSVVDGTHPAEYTGSDTRYAYRADNLLTTKSSAQELRDRLDLAALHKDIQEVHSKV